MKTKVCNKCKIEKSVNDFQVRKYDSGNMGWRDRCKLCVAEYKKQQSLIPSVVEKNKKRLINYYKENKERLDAQQREYYIKNKAKKNAATRKYYKENKDKCYAFTSAYKKEFKDRLGKLAYINHKKRMENDEHYRLTMTLRKRVSEFLKSKGIRKTKSSLDFIGCDVNTVKKHIERQFKKGMSWSNHGFGDGKWNIDHKIPLASAKTKEDLMPLFHYTNLQPLWHTENISKGCKIIPTQISLTI